MQMMNCLQRNARSLVTQIAQRCTAPATRCYHHRVMQDDLGLIRGSAHIKPALRRPLSTSPRPRHLQVLRWYHEPRKVAAATAITLSATVMAACIRYDREIVPCTYRSHLVVYSHQEERDLAAAAFAEERDMYFEKNMIVDPRDPASIRVRLILDRIVHAAHRGLGIDDIDDSNVAADHAAPMLRVSVNEKRRQSRRWGKAAWASKPQTTSHLRGLNWEVIIVRDGRRNVLSTPAGKFVVFAGLFDWYKTDEEIAAIFAHEVGHIIARHEADITKSDWSPPFLRKFFSRRFEIEADYIGILLLGAAGFHPRWFLVMLEKMAEKLQDSALRNIIRSSAHPNTKKRLRLLSQPKTMEEAMELYREVTAMDKVVDKYFR